jgi:phosphinothricin acetyltransferase
LETTSKSEVSIRSATADDAGAVLEIYGPAIKQTTATFETEVPSEEEIRQRITGALATHAWLVAESAGRIGAYAYGGPHRSRNAYRFSAEVSVYVHSDYRRRGLARSLYEELFTKLAARGYYHAFAGISVPNQASEDLHQKLGFESIGVFKKVGFKFGRWHDVSWWQRMLRDGLPDM